MCFLKGYKYIDMSSLTDLSHPQNIRSLINSIIQPKIVEIPDRYVAKLKENLLILNRKSHNPNFGTLDFEALNELMSKKERNFEGLTPYELKELVISLAKECYIIKLKNEIYENYLKRQNPAAELERKHELTEEEAAVVKKLLDELKNAEIKLSSKELYWMHQQAKGELNKERYLFSEFEERNINFFTTVVEREIGELYRKAKKTKIEYEKKIGEIQAKTAGVEEENEAIEELINLIQSMFGETLSSRKKRQQKIDPLQVARYVRQSKKLLDQRIRRINVKTAKIVKEMMRLKEWQPDSPGKFVDF